MNRLQLLDDLAGRITKLDLSRPVRVAIDGVDAAGKTTLANELVPFVQRHDRRVIRASIDGFHQPARIRYQRGRHSPEGYYYDSFDYEALVKSLLAPLGPAGSGKYQTAVFNFRTDCKIEAAIEFAKPTDVLLFDGVFLLRPQLKNYWEFSVFVDSDFEQTLVRAESRDAALFGGIDGVRTRYRERYIPGQKLYLAACRPKEVATVVVDNNCPTSPILR